MVRDVPSALGRSVLVEVGAPVPEPWSAAPVVRLGAPGLEQPGAVVEQLHEAWAARRPVVVELAVDPARFRDPVSIDGVEPWRLAPHAEVWLDRLHFLVWNNAYDARGRDPVWWWGVKASRLADSATVVDDGGPGDVVLADGRRIWIDGGPRQPIEPAAVGGCGVVHFESVELGLLTPVPAPAPPDADLAPDQLDAVAHGAGPARVIAPAGSGKTRVLTERLRHLHVQRGYERETTLAVAYNKQAQLELEARTTSFMPRVRTLNSLGLWVLAERRGAAPPVVDEREVRRIIESLLPRRRARRSNTDPIGPYVEALTAIRLGLTDPDDVEAARDDVDGLADMFPAYRRELARRGAVDFDEQIYAAVEELLADGVFRRSMQRHCRHLLVDEFQDLTPAHVLLLRLLAAPGLDVFGVGDDDQCIYGHAGADPAFLIEYGSLFPAAGAHPLEVNYRCPGEVVAGARALLGYNHRRVAKQIRPGPANDVTPGALRIVEHGPDDGATCLVDVVGSWLAEPGVEPASIAVLARVNSMLLAPHVALHESGIAVSSVLTPDVLERTGMRAALAYLRIAASGDRMDPDDVAEILRRPTRGLPQWFPDRLARRASWRLEQLRAVGGQVPDKESSKVARLADDLALVLAAGRTGSTRRVLEVVRDDVGLGSAMSLLDRTGGGQGSSHLDDLEGLLGVADLHPDPGGFEAWLRSAFRRERDADGVTLSTIHRVKGREWDRVAVFGVADGIAPHRLADDLEEERRVLHVAVTRCRHRVAVLGDRTRRSTFLDELRGTAPKALAAPPVRSRAPAKLARSAPLPELTGAAAHAEAALRAWRTERSRADGVPAFVVVNDRHLLGIAAALPASPAELVACDGIGPAKLERYGDEILAVIESLSPSDA